MIYCYFDEIDSTNLSIKNLIKDSNTLKLPDCFAFIAEQQNYGVGKFGKSWVSYKGNLHLSIAVKKGDFFNSLQDTGIVSLTVSLAIRETIQKYLDDFGLDIASYSKWPNDIIVDGAKIAGILLEIIQDLDGVDYLIIGIGVNLLQAPNVEGYPTISLRALIKRDIDNQEFTSILEEKLFFLLKIKDSKYILDKFKKKLCFLNQKIKIVTLDKQVQGVFIGLTKEGYLLLDSSEGIVVITTGEVFGL